MYAAAYRGGLIESEEKVLKWALLLNSLFRILKQFLNLLPLSHPHIARQPPPPPHGPPKKTHLVNVSVCFPLNSGLHNFPLGFYNWPVKLTVDDVIRFHLSGPTWMSSWSLYHVCVIARPCVESSTWWTGEHQSLYHESDSGFFVVNSSAVSCLFKFRKEKKMCRWMRNSNKSLITQAAGRVALEKH